jgi:urea transport system permease protein
MTLNRRIGLQVIGYSAFCVAILVVPLFVGDAYLLNKFARYIVFGLLSVALSLSWGYAGILNLGQAVSFGLGSYCMAMALKLRTVPIQTGAGGLPDFMVWNNVESLPWFWVPFHSYGFAIFAGIAVPAALACFIGWFVFRARVTGVYVAIITLAMLVVINLLIVDQQRYFGGFNGITDLTTFSLFGVEFDAYSTSTYYLAAITLTVFLFLGLAFTNSKTGLILQAIRDDETRVRYFGYDVANYQSLVFCISAAVAGIAGMLYTLVMEFASPTFLGVPISLSIVIWCALRWWALHSAQSSSLASKARFRKRRRSLTSGC